LDGLADMTSRLPLIHDVRGLGLFFGIELRRDGTPASEEADRVLYHSLSQGLCYKEGGSCVLTQCPPMTSNANELDHALDIIEDGIASV